MIDWLGTYDLLLLAISVPLLVAVLASTLVAVPASYLLGAGGIPAGGLVGYALFVDPP
jgi:hypothetical protein